jgi:hypothetical protein
VRILGERGGGREREGERERESLRARLSAAARQSLSFCVATKNSGLFWRIIQRTSNISSTRQQQRET